MTRMMMISSVPMPMYMSPLLLVGVTSLATPGHGTANEHRGPGGSQGAAEASRRASRSTISRNGAGPEAPTSLSSFAAWPSQQAWYESSTISGATVTALASDA